MKENKFERFINNIIQDRNLEGKSINWANWKSKLSPNTCLYCAEKHGTIVDISILNGNYEVDAHDYCACIYVPMRTKKAGTATEMGYSGADAQLFYLNKLPDYYVSKDLAYSLGWKTEYKYLSDILTDKMIGGNIYNNDDYKLPYKTERVWYEADINYKGGKRNRQRILYSNDGLIFVTYDHYQTFYEITQ